MVLNKFYSKESARVEIIVSRPLGDWQQRMDSHEWSLPPTLRKPPKKLILKSSSDSAPIKVKPKPKKTRAKTRKSKTSSVSKTSAPGGA